MPAIRRNDFYMGFTIPGNTFPEVKKDGEHIAPKSKNDKVWRWSFDSYFQKKNLLVFKETKTSPLLPISI